MLNSVLAVWLRAQLRRHDSLSVAAALATPAPPFARAALAPSHGLLDTADFHSLVQHSTPATLGELPSVPRMPPEHLEMWTRLIAAQVVHEPWVTGSGVKVIVQGHEPLSRLQRAVAWGKHLNRPITYAVTSEAAAEQVLLLASEESQAVQVWTLEEAVLTLAACAPDRLRALSELHDGMLVLEGLDHLNSHALMPISSLVEQHRVQGLPVMLMGSSSHGLARLRGLHADDTAGWGAQDSLGIEASQNAWNYRQTAHAFACLIQEA
ncbi:hypothetical protein [Deinococcus hohokamensis]|uniref:Uncharacterized protein n=1 Tax=Deinococcus hohokamensis TaxID=309883 RepID=A0ABV9I6K3_9DEIO